MDLSEARVSKEVGVVLHVRWRYKQLPGTTSVYICDTKYNANI